MHASATTETARRESMAVQTDRMPHKLDSVGRRNYRRQTEPLNAVSAMSAMALNEAGAAAEVGCEHS